MAALNPACPSGDRGVEGGRGVFVGGRMREKPGRKRALRMRREREVGGAWLTSAEASRPADGANANELSRWGEKSANKEGLSFGRTSIVVALGSAPQLINTRATSTCPSREAH